MHNADTNAGWRYHDGTKHPEGDLLPASWWEEEDYVPIQINGLHKQYPDLEAIPLPLDGNDADAHLTLAHIAKILHFSAGITKRIPRGSNPKRPFRAAACTGALYHIELYLVCADMPGLEAGVYHYDVQESALRQLRRGDYRSALHAATHNPALLDAPAVLVYTDVPWRNAQKYHAREYRHAYWDCGTILANTLTISRTQGLSTCVINGFVDYDVNELLGLDTSREMAVSMVALGSHGAKSPAERADISPLHHRSTPEDEKMLDPIREIHQASSLTSPEEVKAWDLERNNHKTPSYDFQASWTALDSAEASGISRESVEQLITRRGSTRQFDPEATMSFRQLSTILTHTVDDTMLNNIRLIVHSAEGLGAGAYALRRVSPDTLALEQTRQGNFRDMAYWLAGEQELARDACVDVFFTCNLSSIFQSFGNRGYRIAQLEASTAAGKMYLAAYAQRLGATGLTFFDDEIIKFFDAETDDSVMFLLALGKKLRKAA